MTAASSPKLADRFVSIGDVRLPLLDFAVARTAVLGITRSGKTFAAKGVAEQLLEAEIPIVVFDAIGVWRYLKTPGLGRDGKGYPVVIAGGAAPDLPLTPDSAPEIVRAAIRENIPLVIDLYDPRLSKADWRRVVQRSFRTLLYENKGLRHVFLEEAAEYAPQRPIDGETYAEVEKLARMGGNVGLGITIINQRAQEIAKAVLELCDNLVLLRQRGSHAISNLEKWLDRVSPDIARTISKELPHMTQGECWVWAEEAERPVRTRTGLLRSFHPDRRETNAAAPVRVAVDTKQFVSRLSGELGDLLEQQKANDPAELKKRVTVLERELAAAKKAAPPAEVRTVEVPVLQADELKRVEALLARMDVMADRLVGEVTTRLQTMVAGVAEQAGELRGEATKLRGALAAAGRGSQPSPAPPQRATSAAPAPRASVGSMARTPRAGMGTAPLAGGERKILTALAQFGACAKTRLAILTGYAHNGGGFNNYLSALRSKGFILSEGSEVISTPEGVEALGDYEPLPTGQALLDYWLGRLGKAERAILSTLAEEYPAQSTKEELAARSGYEASGGGFNNALSKLRTLELISGRAELRASEALFG